MAASQDAGRKPDNSIATFGHLKPKKIQTTALLSGQTIR
jgi:hypothetical protein